MIDQDGIEWGERGDDIAEVILLTNRNLLVFNPKGLQIPYYQRAVNCYRINKKAAQEIADKAKKFFIERHRQWMRSISKKEFEYMLGLRTRQRDREELQSGDGGE